MGDSNYGWILSTPLENLWVTAKFVLSLIKGCKRPPSASAMCKHNERQLKWKKREWRQYARIAVYFRNKIFTVEKKK